MMAKRQCGGAMARGPGLIRRGRGVVISLLAFALVACTGSSEEIAGRWQVEWYESAGQHVDVEVGANTALQPFFVFDRFVSGNAGCNNFGDNGDYEYELADDTLRFPEQIPIDMSECDPAKLMSTETIIESFLWSDSDIALRMDGDKMTWAVGDLQLGFARSADG